MGKKSVPDDATGSKGGWYRYVGSRASKLVVVQAGCSRSLRYLITHFGSPAKEAFALRTEPAFVPLCMLCVFYVAM